MKLSTATLLALPLLAAATPAPLASRQSAGSCNTGTIQCCQQTISSTSSEANLLAGLLGIILGPVDALLGLDCSAVSVVGVGSGTCDASPVCCSDTAVGGLLSIGCVPISL